MINQRRRKCFNFFLLKLLSTINQIRSENDQIESQYQQYNTNIQRHVQELNEQVRFSCYFCFRSFQNCSEF
jgi:methyl-accepting chemotaxis protein